MSVDNSRNVTSLKTFKLRSLVVAGNYKLSLRPDLNCTVTPSDFSYCFGLGFLHLNVHSSVLKLDFVKNNQCGCPSLIKDMAQEISFRSSRSLRLRIA